MQGGNLGEYNRPKLVRPLQRICLGLSIVISLGGLLMFWWAGTHQPRLNSSFAYSANIVSSDSLYDTADQRYLGDRYSTGRLSYQLTTDARGQSALKGSWSISEIDGGPIFTAVHTRAVSTVTGMYRGIGRNDVNNQYFSAPHNLKAGQNYTYRHLLYDAPAQAVYQGEEIVDGLRVFRYGIHYTGPVPAPDATRINVPDDEQLAVKPSLRIWIEPVTGWLVKFEDHGSVIRVNGQTQKVVAPYSRFEAHFASSSIAQQAAYARTLRNQQLFTQRVAPCLCIGIVSGLLFFSWLRRGGGLGKGGFESILIVMLLAGSVTVLAGWLFRSGSLTRLLLGSLPLQPTTVLGLLCASICLVLIRARYWQKSAQLSAAAVIATGIAGPLVAITPLDSQSKPLHGSLFTATTLLILGCSLFLASTERQYRRRYAMWGFSLVVILGIVGSVITLLQPNQSFLISFAHPLPVATPLLVTIAAGTALLILAKQDRFQNSTPLYRHLLRPTLLALPLACLVIVAQAKQDDVHRQLQTTMDTQVSSFQNSLKQEVGRYGDVLTGAQALFASSHLVEPGEWHAYLNTYSPSQHFPAADLIGYAPVVAASEQATFVASLKAYNLPEYRAYTIYPTTPQSTITPLAYASPQTAAVQNRLGYDLSTDAPLSNVMLQARDSGRTELFGRFIVTWHGQKDDVALVLPVYKNGQPTHTVQQRQAAVTGYVFMLIDMGRLVQTARLSSQLQDIDLRIYDGNQSDSEHLAYSTFAGLQPTYTPRLSQQTTIYTFGHPWTNQYYTKPSFRLSEQQEAAPSTILLVGILSYCCLLLVLYKTLRGRWTDVERLLFIRPARLIRRKTRGSS